MTKREFRPEKEYPYNRSSPARWIMSHAARYPLFPLAMLVGENVKGLNSTGDQERSAFQDMIETLQFDFLLEPIQDLCAWFGIQGVQFRENQGGTATERIEFESKVLANAKLLMELGQDYEKYLIDNELAEPNEFGLFEDPDND